MRGNDEDRELERIADFIDLAFNEPDLSMREMMRADLLKAKWKRAAILQSGNGYWA